MRGYLFVFLFATIVAISGCAISTSKVSNSATTPVPPERILSRAYQTPEDGDAHVIVKRDAGFLSSGCDFRVRLQGTLLAALRPAERLDLYLKPGTTYSAHLKAAARLQSSKPKCRYRRGD